MRYVYIEHIVTKIMHLDRDCYTVYCGSKYAHMYYKCGAKYFL